MTNAECHVYGSGRPGGTPTPVTNELVAANAAFVAARRATQDNGRVEELAGPPARRVAIVACMDARFDVYRAFGIGVGEAHVIRNAGGTITDDVVRSLAISQRKLHTREIVLVHHTRCGMSGFADGDFLVELGQACGIVPPWSPGAFVAGVEEDLRESLRAVRCSPFLMYTDAVRGFVYDVDTGEVVETAESHRTATSEVNPKYANRGPIRNPADE